MNKLVVDVEWSDEDKAYIAEGSNFQGLALSARSMDVLMERCNLAIADLLDISQFYVKYQLKDDGLEVRFV